MKVKAALVAFIILGLGFALFQVLFKGDATAISAKKAEAMATELYGGQVLDTKANETYYRISLENDKGIYELYVDEKTGKIRDVKLIERKEAFLTVDDAKNNIEKEVKGKVTQAKQVTKDGQPFVEATVEKEHTQYKVEYDLKNKQIVSNQVVKNQEKVTPISKQEAKEIALKQLPGKVKKISTVTNEKGPHYVVTVDGEEERANVYVQSNTGRVTSTYWLDLDDDEDDSDSDSDDTDDTDDDNDNDDEDDD